MMPLPVDEIADMLSQSIQKEIDNKVLEILFLTTNKEWIKVKVGKNYTEIPDAWIDENIKDEYKYFGQNWYFKNAQDAAWFMLRWF